MDFAQYIPSFNAGELSPYLEGRNDIAMYASGCRVLENFIVMPYGGVFRRPGTVYLGAAKNADTRCRLIGFNFSTTTSFVLEMGASYFRFWSNGVQVESSPGVPLEVVSAYTEAQIRDVQYVQINDIMYFVHPDQPVMKMTRASDTSWTFAEIVPDWPALLDENITATTVTPSGTSGAITLTASTAIFTSNMVGSYIQVGHVRAGAFVEKIISATGASTSLTVLGAWEFNTFGTWDATLTIQRSYDNGTTWETIRSYKSVDDYNAAATGNEEKAALLRINCVAFTSHVKARSILTAINTTQYGFGKITAFTSTTVVSVTTNVDFQSTAATKVWSEGAWSVKRGFPRTVCLHEGRIFYGGTSYKPLTIWGSIIDDFQNFRISSVDDAGLSFTLSSSESNPIQWITSQDRLLVGTAGDEWTLGASDQNSTITPTNVQALRQSSYGSKYLRSLVVNDVILFVQRAGRKVRELVYSFQTDGWVAPDLTVLSEHVTDGEIVELAYQQQQDAIYWVVTGNGELCGMTYEREQKVIGWHRHTTDGTFESVATIYGGTGPDQVWVAVKRTINGVTKRYVERFNVNTRAQFEEADKESWWYLDCAKRIINSPASATVSGLSHLEGKEVDILADGAVSPSKTVASAVITLQDAQENILVGLPFVSTIQPMFFEIATQAGSSVGTKKRIPKAFIYLRNSLGGSFSWDGVAYDTIHSRGATDLMDSSPPVFSGPYEAIVAGSSARTGALRVRQDQPLPLTVLTINTYWDIASA
jgi:hypothetical protein